MQYRPEIDGLRAVAVVPVILFHAGFHDWSGGFAGVDVFFVISGYLITSILLGDLAAGSFSIWRFYERRARRILPALFVVMAACIPPAIWLMAPSQLIDFGESLIATSFFASNFLFWSESGYFGLAAEFKPLLHTWSLAVEEQFYLLFPPLLWLLWRQGRPRIVIWLAGLAGLSFVYASLTTYLFPSANFYLLPARIWELLAGSLCAVMIARRAPTPNNILSALGLALIVASFFVFDQSTLWPGPATLAPVLGTALVILFADTRTFAGRVLSLRGFVGIGLISYSAYLWHQPLFAFARLHQRGDVDDIVMAGLSVLALLLAWGTWAWIEQPFRRRHAPLLPSKPQVFGASFVCAIGLCIFGATSISSRGFISPESELQNWPQILSEYRAARVEAIKLGECHFNWREISLPEFLGQWACLPEIDGTETHFFITGDSHAADRSVAFRSIGLNIGYIGGAGCPLIPRYDSDPGNACRDIHDRALAEVRGGNYVIVLANRFGNREVAPEKLQEVFDI